MKYVVIGTAGHIDHGKTSLIKALTGIDTDRLPEEKRRGITIDLGFAHYQLTPKLNVSFIDVPGHERLVKNMISGASGIDMVLLVIAADEGIMPQTIEHANICEILGIKHGVVAITKIDLVDEVTLNIVKEEVSDFLKRRKILNNAPIVCVSAKTKEGLRDLVEAIEKIALSLPDKKVSGPFRLHIDRVFSVKGFGTVVTGTVASGKVNVGEEVEVLPKGKITKVRNIQVQGQNRDYSKVGERCALNLQGVEKDEIERGDVVATLNTFKLTQMIDAKIFVIEENFKIKDLQPIRVHIATKEVIGKIKLLNKAELIYPESGYCRIHFDEPITAVNRIPIVLRSYSPVYTIGGGVILDALPETKRIKRNILYERLKMLDEADEKERIELFIKWHPEGIPVEILKYKAIDPLNLESVLKKLAEEEKIILLEDIAIHSEHLKDWEEKIKKEVSEYLKRNPLKKGIPVNELAQKAWKYNVNTFEKFLENFSDIEIENKRVILKDVKVKVDENLLNLITQIEKEFLKSKLSPPKIEDIFKKYPMTSQEKQQIIGYLIENKILIRISKDILVHKKWLNNMIRKVEDYFNKKEELKVSDFKDMFELSRKYAIPYLEYLDKIGITKRVGNVRRRK